MKKPFSYWAAWAGLLGVALSATAIGTLAALRTDGYSHLTKAVSELGSLDAPRHWLFNFSGYVVPGLLIAALAWGLAQGWPRHRWPVGLLAASGLCMVLAGLFPVDMAHRTAPGSLVHLAGSLGSGLGWLGCAATVAPALRAYPDWAGLRRWLPWLPVVTLGLMLLVPGHTPGLAQRVSFVGYFGFVAALANRLRQVSATPMLPTQVAGAGAGTANALSRAQVIM